MERNGRTEAVHLSKQWAKNEAVLRKMIEKMIAYLHFNILLYGSACCFLNHTFSFLKVISTSE